MTDYAKIEFSKSELVGDSDVKIHADLRKRLAAEMDERLMRVALGGRGYPPTTLYVDKYGNYSTVNPKEREALFHRNRAFGGLIVSS